MYPGQEPDVANFYGEITGMDHAFGKLRDSLGKLGIRDNTLLWYCSDNGGLPGKGSTGGRAHKASIYEGGLRVPAIIEWPLLITQNRATDIPAGTSDIYPTILDILNIQMKDQPVLDGISLMPLIRGGMEERNKPMGFWQYPSEGIHTPSRIWMPELLEAQKAGRMVSDSSRLRLDAGEIKKQYPRDEYPGHAAWLNWPWKLHKIHSDEGYYVYELYRLDKDSMEQQNLISKKPEIAGEMKAGLEKWQLSVISSLHGKDYPEN